MILSQAIGEFLLARRVDGRADTTLSWYKDRLKHLDSAIGHYHIHMITANMMRTYIAGLMSSHRSEETVKSMRRGLHAFWGWVAKEYDIPNPMRNIEYPKKPKQREVEHLTRGQLERLFRAAKQSLNPERDALIIWLLLDTGLRSAGCRNLKWKQINLDQRTMYVTEKGGKARTVAFGLGTAKLLRDWYYTYGRREYVFCGVGEKPLTKSGFRTAVKRVGDTAGIPAFPHMLRHNFAMNWMENGGEITALQKQMGHSSINTTITYYLRFAPSVLVRAHKGIPVPLNVMRG